MIRVMIVDDQAMVRVGFRMILETEDDLTVVGEAADGQEAIEMIELARPDVVLMDVRMPRLDGIAATEHIVRRAASSDDTRPGVLMLTTFDMDEYVYAALRAGASGFLLKDAPPEQLIDAIRVVARGDALLAPAVTRRVIEEFARQSRVVRSPDVIPGFAELTERERDVLKLVAKGLSNSEIAEALYLGEATVKTHLGRVLNKLDLRDRVQIVVFAYESGLIAPGPLGASLPAERRPLDQR